MIFGAHVTLYSTDAVADRAFLAEVLGLPAVDAGQPASTALVVSVPPMSRQECGQHRAGGIDDDIVNRREPADA